MANERTCSRCEKSFSRDDGLDTQETLCPDCQEEDAYSPTEAPPEKIDPRNALKPGSQFQGMEIIAILGQGGMGIVYKARQPELNRVVALKVLAPHLGNNPEFRERFQREARALAGLTHPNIVTIHDFGRDENLCYFVMEYIPGQNLRTLLRRKSISREEALALLPQVCDALHYSHRERIVHRDIKPENILLDSNGRVRIADFGLAKLLEEKAPQQQGITAPHQVMGTPAYMSPEQIETPTEVDHRADIYAIGVLLYEILTRELPVGNFAPPSTFPDTDPRLDTIVLKALQKEPEKRYQRAGELREAIREITEQGNASQQQEREKTNPDPSRKRSRILIPGFLFLLVIVAGLFVFQEKLALPQKEAEKPPAAPLQTPFSFEDIFFLSQEAPGTFAFAQTTEVLPRNPFRAEKEADIELSLQNMNDQGLLNLSSTQIHRTYTTVFFRWYLGFFALEAINEPSAKQIAQQATKWTAHEKWIKRVGNTVILAYVHRKEFRYQVAFRQMVNQICKKIKEPAPFPLPGVEFLELFEHDLPPGTRFKGYPLLAAGTETLAEFATDFEEHVPVTEVRGIYRTSLSPSRMEILGIDIPDRTARTTFRDSFEKTLTNQGRKRRESMGTLLLFLWMPEKSRMGGMDFDWIQGLYQSRISGSPYTNPWRERLARASAMDPRTFFRWAEAGAPPETKELKSTPLTALLLTLSESDPTFIWQSPPDLRRIWTWVERGNQGRISIVDPQKISFLGENRARIQVLDQFSFTVTYKKKEDRVVEFSLDPDSRTITRKGRIWEEKKNSE